MGQSHADERSNPCAMQSLFFVFNNLGVLVKGALEALGQRCKVFRQLWQALD